MDNMTFVSLDTETTGLSPETDRIIQYGFSMFIKGACVDTTTFDICQDVPNNAFEINGISDERIRNGHPPYDILVLLQRMFQKQPRRYVVYNSPFDLAFIGAEMERYELDWDFRKLTIVDPLVIWRRFHPFKKGTLSYVSSYYGIPYNDEHDAGVDSAASGHVYCQMHGQHGELRTTYTNKMFKGWYDRWATQFLAYAQSKHLDISVSDFQWPCKEEYLCSQGTLADREESLPLW
jgi:DNA polymerase III subunit epsilon